MASKTLDAILADYTMTDNFASKSKCAKLLEQTLAIAQAYESLAKPNKKEEELYFQVKQAMLSSANDQQAYLLGLRVLETEFAARMEKKTNYVDGVLNATSNDHHFARLIGLTIKDARAENKLLQLDDVSIELSSLQIPISYAAKIPNFLDLNSHITMPAKAMSVVNALQNMGSVFSGASNKATEFAEEIYQKMEENFRKFGSHDSSVHGNKVMYDTKLLGSLYQVAIKGLETKLDELLKGTTFQLSTTLEKLGKTSNDERRFPKLIAKELASLYEEYNTLASVKGYDSKNLLSPLTVSQTYRLAEINQHINKIAPQVAPKVEVVVAPPKPRAEVHVAPPKPIEKSNYHFADGFFGETQPSVTASVTTKPQPDRAATMAKAKTQVSSSIQRKRDVIGLPVQEPEPTVAKPKR